MDSNCESHREKMIGKPYMRKPYVRFEVAGDGEMLWTNLNGHETGNGGYSQGDT
jgi:hypothetical protein